MSWWFGFWFGFYCFVLCELGCLADLFDCLCVKVWVVVDCLLLLVGFIVGVAVVLCCWLFMECNNVLYIKWFCLLLRVCILCDALMFIDLMVLCSL